MKLFFDFFPLILFFVAFKLQGIYVATAIAIIGTICQIGWVAFRHRKVDAMLWVSLAVIVVFGGATLLLHDETFIKWKPTVLYWMFGLVLLGSELIFKRNLIRAMMHKQFQLPEPAWRKLNFSWAGFFLLMGVINLYVAFNFSTENWVNFKVFGGFGLMLLFVLIQGVLLSRYLENEGTD